jgi:hypothetical protein
MLGEFRNNNFPHFNEIFINERSEPAECSESVNSVLLAADREATDNLRQRFTNYFFYALI